MKKKLLLLAIMIIAIMSIFAITASAASQHYTTFDVTLTDGTTKTAYSVGTDKYEGRIYLNAKLYAEAPLDSDGTYAEIDWTTVKEIDFSSSMIYFYDKGAWNEMAYGLNQSNTALCVMTNGISKSTQLTSLEKIITGKLRTIRGSTFGSCPALNEIVFSDGLIETQNNAFDSNSSLATLDFSACTTLKNIGQQTFKKCTALVNVILPNTITSMGTEVFSGCTALETINWPTSMTKIPNSTFHSCSKLKAFVINDNVVEIGNSVFKDCTSLTSVYIPGSVTYIGSDCWRGCSSVTSITFDPACSVTHLYAHTFDGTKATTIKLPNTVTSIGQNCFAISTLKTLILGASFNNFNASNASQPPLTGANMEFVYLPSTFTADSIRASIFSWNDNNENDLKSRLVKLAFIYTGTKEQAQAIIDAANGDYSVAEDGTVTGTRVNTYIATMILISAEEYKAKVEAGTLEIGEKNAPKRYLVYGYNLCDAFYDGVHYIKDSIDCTEDGDCDRCKLESIVKGFEKHNYVETLVYANGFTGTGVYNKICQNLATCTCGNIVDEKADPIFIAKGYSNSENGIAGGYTVNITAYNNYVDITGKTITFGVLMLNPKYLDGKDSFFNGTNVNIDGTKGYVKVDMTNLSYKDFTYSITGFGADSKDVDLVVCAFAYVEGEDVEFIQDQTTKCASKKVTKNDATLYTVTFNTVEAKAGNVIASLVEYKVPGKED